MEQHYYIDSDKMVDDLRKIMKFSDNVKVSGIIQYINDNSIPLDDLKDEKIHRLEKLVDHYEEQIRLLEDKLIEIRSKK